MSPRLFSKPFRFLVFLLALAPILGHGAGIQKWVDDNGKVHYGERAPSAQKAVQIKNQISVVDAANTNAIATLYTTKWCGYCKKARAFLAQNSIRYREVDIEKSAVDNQRYKQLGGKGVPFLVRGNDTLQGFSEARYSSFFDLLR